jgi:glycosyltransferase involved in cell wall biosynthesis
MGFILGINRKRILERLLVIKPQIVHAHDYEYSYLCVSPSYPIVNTPHGIPRLESKYFLNPLHRWRYWLDGVMAELLFARFGENFILISEYSRKELKIPVKARVFIVPNSVRSDFFMLENRAVNGRLLFVAADVTPRKNPLLLLKAIADLKESLPHISLRLVGYFSNDAFHNSIKEFIRQNQMEQHIHFTGPLNDDQLMKEYEECSVLVLTSEWENLPVVIKQAMAAGKPVIATRTGGVQEMIQDGTTGLSIPPGDLNALIRGIEILLKDDESRQRMGRAAREEALKKFSGEVVARKTLEAYRTILNQ